jgi:hypothetical protein
MEIRKELDITLEEAESQENLQADCKKSENIAMKLIKMDAVKRLEELRLLFIHEHHLRKDEQPMVNRVFNWLKEKA